MRIFTYIFNYYLNFKRLISVTGQEINKFFLILIKNVQFLFKFKIQKFEI